ncbi:MAG TPA: hypothetical protein VFV37_02295 [Luteibaculaceae bacterium]|nr:hypothetical protein [Luteibaculaceae bacterium]
MEAILISEQEEIKRRSRKMLMYIGIFSIVMLFAGLTSAYVVTQSDKFWVKISLPNEFYVSTLFILLSSYTMWLCIYWARLSDTTKAYRFLLITLALGLLFSVFQFLGWGSLFDRGHTLHGENIFLIKGEYGKDYSFLYKGQPLVPFDGDFYEQTDKLHEKPLKDAILGSRDTASSYLVAITFLHFMHLAGGLLYILSLIKGIKRGKYNAHNTLSLELCGTYWHFLDGLWIYLLLFLLFIH